MQNVTELDYHYVWIQVSTPVTKTVIYKPVYFKLLLGIYNAINQCEQSEQN